LSEAHSLAIFSHEELLSFSAAKSAFLARIMLDAICAEIEMDKELEKGVFSLFVIHSSRRLANYRHCQHRIVEVKSTVWVSAFCLCVKLPC